jgi:hypothetical protein
VNLRAHRIVALVACLGALSALAIPRAESQEQEASLESFRGTFVLAGTGERAALVNAIDRVADQFDIFVREIARGELRRRLSTEERIRVAIDETAVEFAFDNWVPGRIPLDGRVRTLRGPGGETLRHSVRFEGGRIIERRVGGGGERMNVLTMSPDHQRMIMSVRISSDQLPDAIRYRLAYRRAG